MVACAVPCLVTTWSHLVHGEWKYEYTVACVELGGNGPAKTKAPEQKSICGVSDDGVQ